MSSEFCAHTARVYLAQARKAHKDWKIKLLMWAAKRRLSYLEFVREKYKPKPREEEQLSLF